MKKVPFCMLICIAISVGAPAAIKPVVRDVILTATPVLNLPLQEDLVDIAGGHSVSPVGGAAQYGQGKSLHSSAYVLDGSNPLLIQGLSTSGDMTLSAYIDITDLTSSTPFVFDSGDSTGNIKVYFKDNAAGVTLISNWKTRDVGLVFEVKGNLGGDGDTGECVETTYRRFHEHSLDYSVDADHERFPEQHWLHLTVVYSPSNKRVSFYINGKLDSTKFFSTAQVPVLSTLQAGSTRSNDLKLLAHMSHIKFFDQALSDAEVRRLDDFREELWGIQDIDDWELPIRTYVVDGTYLAGDGDGSAAKPFATIQAAVNQLNTLSSLDAPGTQILIKPGTYREWDLNITQSGTRFRPLRIEAETIGSVVISGSEEWSGGWSEVTSGIWSHDWTYNWGGSNLLTRTEVVHIDDQMMRPYFTKTELEAPVDTDLRSQHGFYVDEGANLIYIRTDKDPNQSKMEVSVNDGSLMRFNTWYADGHYTFISGITFQHARGSGDLRWDGTNDALDLFGSVPVVVQDCAFYGNSDVGLDVGRRNALVQRCKFENNGSFAFSVKRNSYNTLVRDCDVRQSLWRKVWGGYTGPDLASVGKIMFSSRINFERCRFFENERHAIWLDGQCMDVTTDECFFGYNTDWAIFYEISTLNLEVRNSSFYKNGDVAFMNYAESCRLDNNLFYQDTSDGAWGIISQSYATSRVEQLEVADIYCGHDLVLRDNVFMHTLSGGSLGDHKLMRFNDTSLTPDSFTSASNTFYHAWGVDKAVFGVGGAENWGNLTFDQWALMFHDTSSEMVGTAPFSATHTPQVMFEQGQSTIPESLTARPIHIYLSEPVDKTISVTVQIQSQSAVEGGDFRVLGETTLTFEPLERTRSIYVEALLDGVAETDETLQLVLANPSGATIGSQGAHIVTIPGAIINNVLPPVFEGYDPAVVKVLTDTNVTVSAYDPEGASLSYSWSQASGPASANLLGVNNANPLVQFPQMGDYELRVIISDGELGITNICAITVVETDLPEGSGEGSVDLNIWNNYSSSEVGLLPSVPGYPDVPDVVESLTELAYSARGDGYGAMIRGYLMPPVSGTYSFYIASDDSSEFWLSTTTNSSAKVLVAEVVGSVPLNSPNQGFVTVNLVAGKRYYFETLHAEGSGEDYFQLEWACPMYEKAVISAQHITSQAAELDLSTASFTAYNDLCYLSGEVADKITTFSANQTGDLIDYESGKTTPISFSMIGGRPSLKTGYAPNSGSDADLAFSGKVGLDGYIYPDTTIATTLEFSGLDPDQTYEIVFFGNQNKFDSKETSLTLSRADSFSNTSSIGSVKSTVSVADDTTTTSANNPTGLVIHYSDIDPGADGVILISTPVYDRSDASKYTLNAFLLKSSGRTVPVADPALDTDSDGVNDFLEEAFGTDINVPDRPSFFIRNVSGDIEYTIRNLKDGYTYEVQTAPDLTGTSWTRRAVYFGQTDGTESVLIIRQSEIGASGKLFVRLVVSN